jgi:uncharacterized damage-inducible protein DinB
LFLLRAVEQARRDGDETSEHSAPQATIQVQEIPMGKNTSKLADASKRKVLPSRRTIEKPEEGEYPAHAHIYIDLLPSDGLILQHLENNLKSTKKFIASIPKARLLHRYAEGKWTIKEILGHLVDDERIYVYRALRFARNDSTELPGFDQDHYAQYSVLFRSEPAGDRGSSKRIYFARQSTAAFFNSLDDAALMRTGVAEGNRASMRALTYHIVGHELRHMNIIKERYLQQQLKMSSKPPRPSKSCAL